MGHKGDWFQSSESFNPVLDAVEWCVQQQRRPGSYGRKNNPGLGDQKDFLEKPSLCAKTLRHKHGVFTNYAHGRVSGERWGQGIAQEPFLLCQQG